MSGINVNVTKGATTDGIIKATAEASQSRDEALQYRNEAEVFKESASLSSTSAFNSKNSANASEAIVASKANEANVSAANALASETNSSVSEGNALISANNASVSASEALVSANNAEGSEAIAITNANEAILQAGISTAKANESSVSANDSLIQANRAKTEADRAKQEADNIGQVSTTPINMSAMLQGTISLSNTIEAIGFNTHLYTGNGTTQDIVTGVDMKSNWDDYSVIPTWIAGTYNTDDEVKITDTSGRILRCVCLQDGVTSDPNTLLDFTDATFSDWKLESKTFGGRVWIKSRSSATWNIIYDTIRGNKGFLSSNSSQEEVSVGNIITGFSSNGFSLGQSTSSNNLNSIYVSWSDQTTFVESFLTSHNKPAIRETNVITGYVQIKYKGSGLAGHEIEHGMGRELGIAHFKRLNTTSNWLSVAFDMYGRLDSTDPFKSNATIPALYAKYIDAGTAGDSNEEDSLFILYGYTNAYIDENDNLQGNYEIGTYTGTGASGNKVETKGKPAYVMIKRIDDVGNWHILDNQREENNGLFADLSSVEVDGGYLSFGEDAFTIIPTSNGINASGSQYLYLVIYDNDSGSGSSKYTQPTDTTQAQITGGIASISNGFNATRGVDNDIVQVSGTLIPTNNWQGE